MPALPNEVRIALDHLALAYPAVDLAADLYGARWRDAVYAPTDYRPTYKTRRVPVPAFLARFLRPALLGSVAHDGRSRAEDRGGGWWAHLEPADPHEASSPRWTPVDPSALAFELAQVIDAVGEQAAAEQSRRASDLKAARAHLEATRRRWYAEDEHRRAEQSATRGQFAPLPPPSPAPHFVEAERVDEATRQLDDADLRCELISAVSYAVAAGGRTWRATLSMLRTDLRMPTPTLVEIAHAWLLDELATGALVPSTSGRLTVGAVRAAHSVTLLDEPGFLPLQLLFRALDALLGGRIRDREWRLDALDPAPTPAPEVDEVPAARG